MDVTELTFDDEVIERSHERARGRRLLGGLVRRRATRSRRCSSRPWQERAGEVELAKVDVDANPGLSQPLRRLRHPGGQGVPGRPRGDAEFVGARSPASVVGVARRAARAARADALVEELRASGELPDVVAALDAGRRRARARADRRRRARRRARRARPAARGRGGAVRAPRPGRSARGRRFDAGSRRRSTDGDARLARRCRARRRQLAL